MDFGSDEQNLTKIDGRKVSTNTALDSMLDHDYPDYDFVTKTKSKDFNDIDLIIGGFFPNTNWITVAFYIEDVLMEHGTICNVTFGCVYKEYVKTGIPEFHIGTFYIDREIFHELMFDFQVHEKNIDSIETLDRFIDVSTNNVQTRQGYKKKLIESGIEIIPYATAKLSQLNYFKKKLDLIQKLNTANQLVFNKKLGEQNKDVIIQNLRAELTNETTVLEKLKTTTLSMKNENHDLKVKLDELRIELKNAKKLQSGAHERNPSTMKSSDVKEYEDKIQLLNRQITKHTENELKFSNVVEKSTTLLEKAEAATNDYRKKADVDSKLISILQKEKCDLLSNISKHNDIEKELREKTIQNTQLETRNTEYERLNTLKSSSNEEVVVLNQKLTEDLKIQIEKIFVSEQRIITMEHERKLLGEIIKESSDLQEQITEKDAILATVISDHNNINRVLNDEIEQLTGNLHFEEHENQKLETSLEEMNVYVEHLEGKRDTAKEIIKNNKIVALYKIFGIESSKQDLDEVRDTLKSKTEENGRTTTTGIPNLPTPLIPSEVSKLTSESALSESDTNTGFLRSMMSNIYALGNNSLISNNALLVSNSLEDKKNTVDTSELKHAVIQDQNGVVKKEIFVENHSSNNPSKLQTITETFTKEKNVASDDRVSDEMDNIGTSIKVESIRVETFQNMTPQSVQPILKLEEFQEMGLLNYSVLLDIIKINLNNITNKSRLQNCPAQYIGFYSRHVWTCYVRERLLECNFHTEMRKSIELFTSSFELGNVKIVKYLHEIQSDCNLKQPDVDDIKFLKNNLISVLQTKYSKYHTAYTTMENLKILANKPSTRSRVSSLNELD